MLGGEPSTGPSRSALGITTASTSGVSRSRKVAASAAAAMARRKSERRRRITPPSYVHDPEKWKPVSRLREAQGWSAPVHECFGGRRQVGKDHAQDNNDRARLNPPSARSP